MNLGLSLKLTLAAALDEKLIEPDTEFYNLPKSLTYMVFQLENMIKNSIRFKC